MTSKNPIVQNALNATTKTYDPNRRPSVIVGEINRKCPKLSAKVDAWFVWVEFRDKKGVKGRLPDAIMSEPGFPRDKLEVARVDADGVMFTVKGNPYVNAKFAVTTKSGRSVVIEAPNYKAAEKEAKRRFGAGCIVDLVGNSVAANFNYKNKYQWFVVTPSMSGACILAGNEYREDAQEVFKEIKDEEGISCKVVARRTLERAGIDPNVSESWAKGIRKAVANAKFKVGDVVGLKIMDGGRRDYVVWRVRPTRYDVCYASDYGVGCEVVDIYAADTGEFIDKHNHIDIAKLKAKNATIATNYKTNSEFEVGDTVRFRDNVRSVPHDETYKVIKVNGARVTIKGGRDGGTSVEFADRLEPVFNSTRNCEMKSTNPIVQKALNATVAKNANEPLIRYIKSNIQTKFPQSSLEGYTDGVTSLIERGNGKITILADRKARPALDQLKAKFEPDYIFAFVDYGRGKTGFTMTPRAHTQRGEFKVANAVVTNALAKKQFGNVTAYLYKGLAGISVNSISHQAEGDAPKDCVASAKAMLAEYEKAVTGIKNAIAWMSAL